MESEAKSEGVDVSMEDGSMGEDGASDTDWQW
jgi:hypothetical protein